MQQHPTGPSSPTKAPTGRVLSIQSHTVYGYVGNKSAIFPLQLLGLDVDPIHSVHFSNHTGYPVVRGRRLQGQELLEIFEGLEANQLMGQYTHILTGYIGTSDLLSAVSESIQRILSSSIRPVAYVCDPVLGDNGRLYVPKDLVEIYRSQLLPLATMVTPNQFECEVLTGRTIASEAGAFDACHQLHELGPKYVVITSLNDNDDADHDNIHVIASERVSCSTLNQYRVSVPRVEGYYTGTGDLFSALLLAWTFHHPTQFLLAVQKALGTMATVLKRTYERAGKGAELQLIQSRDTIQSPSFLPPYRVVRAAITGLIFDLDGTLTLPHSMCFNSIRSQFEIPSDANLLAAIAEFEPEIQQEAEAAILAEEHAAAQRMALQPHVVEVLRDLEAANIPIAIATRNTHAAVERFLTLAQLSSSMFQSIVTRDFTYVKPDPKVAHSICAAFRMHPSNVLFVGDLPDDIACGRDAGCRTALMLNDSNRDLESQVDFSLTTLRQLKALVLG